jgi:hypothetical protein
MIRPPLLLLLLLLLLLPPSLSSVIDTHLSPSIQAGEAYCYSGRVESAESCPADAQAIGAYAATYMTPQDKVTVTLRAPALTTEGRHRDSDSDRRLGDAPPGDAPLYSVQFALVPLASYAELTGRCCYLPSLPSPAWPVDSCSAAAGGGEDLQLSLPFPGSRPGAAGLAAGSNALLPLGVAPACVSQSLALALDAPPLAPPLSFSLSPPAAGAFLLYASNCAVLHGDGQDNRPSSFNLDEITLTWSFQAGTLGSLAGLTSFYATSFAAYFLLSVLWLRRSRQFAGSLLGLQRAISLLVYAECCFSLAALAYYAHLNRSDVDLAVLYSGTFAALESWDFWSLLVTATHFAGIFACQVVVTLVADGKWLIQHTMRSATKIAVAVLGGLWAVLLLFYGAMSPATRRGWAAFR